MKNTVEIQKLGINGEGIGYVNKKVTFIPGALPQEKVEAEITMNKRGFCRGKLLKVMRESSARQDVECSQYDHCMGCTLSHMKYENVLEAKKQMVSEALNKYTGYEIEDITMFGAKQTQGYLDNVNLPITEFKGRLVFGIYQRETKYLTTMSHCLKHHPLINQTLQTLETIFRDTKCKAYDEKRRTGLRFIKLRRIGQAVQMVFITGKDGLKEETVKRIISDCRVDGLFVSVNNSRHQDFENQGYKKIYGNTKIDYHYHDHKNIISIKSDIPENYEMNEKYNDVIKDMLKDSQKVISLYCGIGLLEMDLDQEVVAIDSQKTKIEDAKNNAKFNKRENVKFISGQVENKVITFAKKKIYDTIIIHCHDENLTDELKETMRLSNVNTVIIASNTYYSLFKELDDLRKYFDLQEMSIVDQSPSNAYMTTIMKLQRKK